MGIGGADGIQRIGRQIEGDQMGQRHVRPSSQSDVGQLQLFDVLQVVEQFLEVGAQRVEAQIELDQAVEVREDIVRQQRQSVVGQLQRHQIRHRRHHHGVQMLDLNVVQSKISQIQCIYLPFTRGHDCKYQSYRYFKCSKLNYIIIITC